MSKPGETLKTGHIDVDNARLYYEIIGAGYPVTLIHDGLVDCRVWDEQISFLAEQYQAIRYDRRGYGRSQRPWADYFNVEDLHTLLHFLEIEQTSLMGVSAGGMIAIDFTLAHPDMVDALVLVGTAVSGFEISEHMQQRVQAAVRPLIEDDDVEQTIENWVNDPYFVSPANTTARLRFREFLTTSPHNLYDPHWHSFEEPGQPAIGRLSEIHVPTLLIVGEADIPDNHAVSGALQVGIRGSKRVVLPNAGHLANLEQPQIFNQLVSEFLESALHS
ncbi:alpha/beta fold hydrolase [Chloroflexota bacterium]